VIDLEGELQRASIFADNSISDQRPERWWYSDDQM
jgi:hypothetical protein